MKGDKCLATENGLQKRLMNFTLILSLFTFSGYVSEAKTCNTEPARIELTTKSTNSKRIICFKKAFNSLSKLSNSTSEIKELTPLLLRQENLTRVKFKSVLKELATIEKRDKGFLQFYSDLSPDELLTDYLRG